MKINFIGVPIFYGSDKKGPDFAPSKLRDKQIIDVIRKHGHNVYDMGDINVPEQKDYNKFYAHSNLKYLNEIVEVNTNLAHSVYSSIKAESFPLIVGGDHSVGLGSISGVSKACDDFAVVWMDAHGDINTHETSGSGNIHGMPLGAAMGIGHERLTNIYFDGNKVKPENVFILGARDLDGGEIELIKEKNLSVLSPQEMDEKGLANVVEEIVSTLKQRGIKSIHLSFDMDYIDSKFVPGTGTPVSKGHDVEETKTVLKALAGSGMLKSMDFVELNVILDRNDRTADLAVDILDWTFRHMK